MAVKFGPWNLPKVGDLVYFPFQILKPAKVISVVKSGKSYPYPEYNVTMKFLDGHTEVGPEWSLSDFNHATDEHLSKYNKFDAIRQKLKALK